MPAYWWFNDAQLREWSNFLDKIGLKDKYEAILKAQAGELLRICLTVS